jgi:lipopolysaccharide transport system ATP-binding protein
MSTVIKVENVSKQYRLGNVGSGTMRDDLTRWWYRMQGKEDPLLKIGSTNDRSQKADSDYVWALKDINFDVQQGDVLGIIGRNGAGKSTLLKILSKTTAPTTGSVKVKGRIASLLEVGTGFHPELTGRENIYLNGAILGMRKHEITRKLDEIIDFAGVERYIDTPVKRYSSGMYVRLAFGVAAHLESEILIIDEVLAVGDAEFQKKCLGKIGEVSKGEGRTVLFVSHNLAAVKALCSRGVLLENGLITLAGMSDDVMKFYLGGDKFESNHRFINHEYEGLFISDIKVFNPETGINKSNNSIYRDNEIWVNINYNNKANINNLYFNIKLKDDEGNYFLVTASPMQDNFIRNGQGSATMKIPQGFFNEGGFAMDLMIIQYDNGNYKTFFHDSDLLHFQILPEKRDIGTWMGKEVGYIRHTFDWHHDS